MGYKVIDEIDHYYIYWKGYLAEDDSWELVLNLTPETLKMWEDSKKTQQTTRISQQ